MSKKQAVSGIDKAGKGLVALNSIGQTLFAIQDLPATLKIIAENAKDVLGADIVDLYEFDQKRDEFSLPPILVGERWNPFIPKIKIFPDDVVIKIIQSATPQYFPNAQNTRDLMEKFSVPRPDAPEQRFVVREGIVSSVSLPLLAGKEKMGVMFVNFRTQQSFDSEQKNLIETFSNVAAIAIYNARLYKAERERRQLADTLQETSHILNESRTLEYLSDRALEQLGMAIKYSSASVQIFKGEQRIVIGGRGFRDNDQQSNLHRKITADPLIFQIVHSKQPQTINDVENEPLWDQLPQTAHIKSWIGVPLVVKGQVIGLLTVDHTEKNHYTTDDEETIAAFANQLAISIYNHIQTEALTKLNLLSQRLAFIQDDPKNIREVLEKIAQNAKEVLRADIIELYEYSASKRAYELPQISTGERFEPFVPKEIIYEDDVVLELIDRNQPSYIENSQKDDSIASAYTVARDGIPLTGRFAVREKIQSTAAIPLKAGEEPLGLMFANYRIKQGFTKEQRELIELFANQAAIAIQNARLYKRMDRKIEDLDVLGTIGQRLTANIRLNEQEILKLVREQVGELMDVSNMYIALYDQEWDEVRFGLVFRGGKQINVKEDPNWQPRRAGKGRTEEIIRTKTPIFHKTKAEAKVWYAMPEHKEYTGGDVSSSWIGVPMLMGQKVLGVMASDHPDVDNVYSEDDLKILQTIANQTAIALDNARTFQALVEFGQELSAGIGLQEDEILELIYSQATKLMDTANMYIALYDEQSDMVRFGLAFVIGEQVDVEKEPDWQPRKAGKGKTEEIIRTKAPLFHRTQAEAIAWYSEPDHKEYIGTAFASWLGVPMLVEGKVLGVVATYHPTEDNIYTKGDEKILQSMANIAAVAIENARRYGELEEANARIAQKEAVLVRAMIAADFVHHLNNLAGTIPIWVGRIRKRLKSSLPEHDKLAIDIEKYLDNINSDTSRLLREGEQIKSIPTSEPVQVDEILMSLVRQANVQMPADVEIRYDQQTLPPVMAVSSELSNSLWCVLENGVDAMLPEGGLLEISADTYQDAHSKKWLNIQVKDQGKGIREEYEAKIFRPFQSTKPGHMGYGLWRTKNIIENLGGEITFQSVENKGTTFNIILPVSEVGK